ncbi:MAG: antitoxin family protein [Phycisphaerales bacterium JB039]
MVRIIEAVFTDGVLKPVDPLPLREQQRVRLTVEEMAPEAATTNGDRQAAVAQFLDGVKRSRFRSTGPYPTRDELHERHP